MAARASAPTTIQAIVSNVANTTKVSIKRAALPRNMLAIASATNTGWRVLSSNNSALLTGRVLRYSTTKYASVSQRTAPTLQRHAISANPNDGSLTISRKPSRVGEVDFILSNYRRN